MIRAIGGIKFDNSDTDKILVEDCTFHEKVGVRFSKGFHVLNRNCASDCYDFGWMYGSNNMRYMKICSIRNIYGEDFDMSDGDLKCENNNFSYNGFFNHVAFTVGGTHSEPQISYCNFAHNVIGPYEDSYYLFLFGGTVTHQLRYSNYIENKEINRHGLGYVNSFFFYIKTNINAQNCYFIGNEATHYWVAPYGESPLTATFTQCYLENPNAIQGLVLYNYSPISSPTTHNNAFDLGFCQICDINWLLISVDPLSKRRYLVNEKMTISGIVRNPDKQYAVAYIIDDKRLIDIVSVDTDFKVENPFSCSFELPPLTMGSHKIQIMAYYQSSLRVSTSIHSFYFDYISMVIQLNPIKGSYTRVIDSIISVSGNVSDAVQSPENEIWYKIDQLSNTKLIDFSNSDSITMPFTASINIPSSLAAGTHTLYMWVSGSGGQSDQKSLTFSLDYPSPSLSMNQIEDRVYYRMQNIALSGTVSHSDPSDYVIVYYRFNSNSHSELTRVTLSGSKSKTFSKTILLPTDLRKGQNTIYFSATDSRGKPSTTNPSLTFQYDFNTPVLTAKLNKNYFYRVTDTVFTISGTVSDADQIGPVNVWYRIDMLTDTNLCSVSINDANAKPFSENVNIPSSFAEGSHTVYVWAVDNYGKTTTPQELQFNYEYNKPILSLTPIQDKTYRRTIDILQIRGSVSDADTSGYIIIKYRFDTLQENDLVKIDISSSSQYTISQDVEIPRDLPEGSHRISIWAVDNDQKSTNPQYFPFDYAYNSPSLTVDNLQKTIYMRNTEQIVISGIVSNQDGFGSVNIKYKFDDKAQNDLLSVQIENSSPKQFSKRISIPLDFSESEHSVTVWCTGNDGKSSSELPLKFEFKYHNPTLSINMNQNIEYTRITKDVIQIRGSISDNDGLGTVYIRYKIDSQEYKVFQTTTVTSTSPYPINYDLKIDNSSTEGKHTIMFSAIDSDNHLSTELLFSFFYNYNKPVISVNEIADRTYTRRTDSQLTISGYVSDQDGQGFIDIKYQFDDRGEELLLRKDVSDSNNIDFYKQITIPYDIPEGRHIITIFCVDNDNKRSLTVPRFSFSFAYNPPILSIEEIRQGVFTKSIDRFITVNGEVSDQDDIGQVTIYINADDNPNWPAFHVKQSLSNNNKFSFNFTFPATFTEGRHMMKIWAEDDDNKKSAFQYSKEFEYKYNDPNVHIYNLERTHYLESNKLKIKVSGNISHVDGNPNISISYFIDGEKISDLMSVEIPFNTTAQFSEIALISNPPRSGDHTIHLEACDTFLHCRTSENVEFTVVFTNSGNAIIAFLEDYILKFCIILTLKPSSTDK